MNRPRPATEQGKVAAAVSGRIAGPRPCRSVRGVATVEDRFGDARSSVISLVVMIPRCQRGGPGSTPGWRIFFTLEDKYHFFNE